MSHFFHMPQLDKVTFLSQFFWLCFFFLGFYYVLLKFYLPKISRILTLRRKKMGFSHQGILSFKQEHQQIQENYHQLLSKAFSIGKTLFHNFFSRTTNWVNENVQSINQTNYKTVNASYIQKLGETSLSDNLMFFHIEKNLPETLVFKTFLNTLKSKKIGENPKMESSKKNLKKKS